MKSLLDVLNEHKDMIRSFTLDVVRAADNTLYAQMSVITHADRNNALSAGWVQTGSEYFLNSHELQQATSDLAAMLDKDR